ncbi:phage tail tape measure protein [Xenorhabdus bovienii]|uniref:phage tail tape measure protein n=1 Tax=Xenorhabdus bovienii TaxID=40576 RepID=UPI0023B2458B|nr:phage tail tape measure protein [Xenorhabdus bovienii]MDE9466890.1 phage tail tape measure protein [Xenorhabdus bovienii]
MTAAARRQARDDRARETLGVRAERSIQREITRTIAGYNRLARSGTLSAAEQSRAYDAMRQRVAALRNEMQGVSRLAKLGAFGSKMMTVGGGLAAGGMVLTKPVKDQMGYEQRLAYLSNTAFNDRDIAGRKAGKAELHNIIRDSVEAGGGSKEQATDLLSEMLANGAFSFDETKTLMPTLQKYATITGVSGGQLAKVIESLKGYGITTSDNMMKALDAAIRAGQEGAFEFSDMARWLPEILSKAKENGYSGLENLVKIFAYTQGAKKNASSSDEAGNNLANLIAKLNSTDLSRRAAKVKVDGYGIDIAKTLADAQGKGIDPLETLILLTDRVATQNPELRNIEKALAKTDNQSPEYRRLLQSQQKIYESAAIGKLMADQQAMMALLAIRNHREYIKDVQADARKQLTIPKGQGEGDISFAVIADENEFKLQQAKNAKNFAEMNTVEPLSNIVGDLSQRFTDLSKEFPNLTTTVVGATTAIEAMTVAAVAFAGLKFITGRNSVPPGTVTPGGGGGGGNRLGQLGRWLRSSGNGLSRLLSTRAGKAIPIIGTGLATYQGTQDFPLVQIQSRTEKLAEMRQRLGRELTEVENALYGTAGAKDAWKSLTSLFGSDEELSIKKAPVTVQDAEKAGIVPTVNAAQKPQANAAPPLPPITFTSQLLLDGRTLAEATNQYNALDAGRGTGGIYP